MDNHITIKALDNELQFPNNLILLGYRGSIAHGMYIPNTDPNSIDDKDIMGIFVAPAEHYVGLSPIKETIEQMKGPWDAVFYEVKKFVKLLCKSNPNVLSLLWVKDEHILYQNEYGKLLRDARELFVTKNIYHSFAGYAHDQFKKMIHGANKGYMGEKRKALVEKYGYDCKAAAHLIRLLIMCIEFLQTGELIVERPDADELLKFKKGEYTLQEVKEMAEDLFIAAEISYKKSTLPEDIQYNIIEDILIKIIKNNIGE